MKGSVLFNLVHWQFRIVWLHLYSTILSLLMHNLANVTTVFALAAD